MVSILMSTYNREKYLRRAIDSVLAQTYTDWEFVIVDDGSTDQSQELILSYKDERIQYIPMDKNRFYCYAANQGLLKCKGEYVAFLNSDDEWMPDKLEKQIAFMEMNEKYGACFTEVILTDNEGHEVLDDDANMKQLFAVSYNTQTEWMHHFLFRGNTLCHPSAVIRRELLDKIGGFNLLYCQLGDFELWIRIVTESPIYVMSEELIKFRWDVKGLDQASSVTKQHAVRMFNEYMLIRKQLVERLTDEQLILFFQKEFRNLESRTPIQLEFERAFLLLRCVTEVPELKVLGMNKIEEILHYDTAVDVLENHFHMRIQDFYDWNQGHWYMDRVAKEELTDMEQSLNNQKVELSRQHVEISRQQEELVRYRQSLEEYKTSTIWRCTAPLRKLMQAMKGVRR